MAGSSPAPRASRSSRQSLQWPSPERTRLDVFLTPERNSELSHQEALAAAQAEHERVREKAIHVYDQHVRAEEKRRIVEEQEREKERLRAEEAVRREAERLNELKAKSIPKPPPVSEPAKAPVPQPTLPKEQPAPLAQPDGLPQTSTTARGSLTSPAPAGTEIQSVGRSIFGNPAAPSPTTQLGSVKQADTAQGSPKIQSPFSQKSSSIFSQTKPQAPSPLGGISPFQQPQPLPNGNATPSHPPPPPSKQPSKDRYIIVHENLKQLRASLAKQAETNKLLKSKMGDMRREIRKSVGQLTLDKASNKKVLEKIVNTLREGVANVVGSQLVDPSPLVLAPRDPVGGAQHNDQLPSIFLYLLNQFSKAIINQFINECGANPRAADPIGVASAHIFSEPSFLWRGKSLIDMLMAKYRIVCPVLFGLRGSEKTEQGRERLGWRRKGNGWATEQEHMDRMTGLGAGYAAISLRDFTRSKKENPWPPRKYWAAFARIVNTPPQEISNTQCNVLKAMIDHYEQRFIAFYGTAAIAALRIALVDFPARAPTKSTPVTSLEVQAQLLKKDAGLRL